MPVVHLDGPAEEAAVLPVLVRLGLAELLLLCDRSGHPRLPLDLEGRTGEEGPDRLQQRLAAGTPSPEQQAHRLVGEAHEQVADDPGPLTTRLVDLGLLDGQGTPVGDVVAALGILAAPEALMVLDLAERRDDAGEVRLRSYVAITGTQVVQLSTVSGLSYELAWFDVGDLGSALTRAATVDDVGEAGEAGDDTGTGPAGVTEQADVVELPFEVFTDGTEAVRRDREDLLAEVLRLSPGPVRVEGVEVSSSRAARVVTELEASVRGRLRALVTTPQAGAGRRTVGVVSWLLTDGGWRELSPLTLGGVPVLRISPVEPHDLPRAVGPLLAQVVR